MKDREATLPVRSVAILSPGEMGQGVGRALAGRGLTVVTCLAGRSEVTHSRAKDAGFQVLVDLEAVIREADLILSIVPPEAATALADSVAVAMDRTGRVPVYADCNAVSPQTARRIGEVIARAGAPYIDAGILGLPPGQDGVPTRIYASGPAAPLMREIDGNGIEIHLCGDEIGRASAVKMCYAAVSKGTNALHTATMMLAEALGVGEEVRAEYSATRGPMFQRMKTTIPRLPADSARWIGEMEEIAATFESCGISPRFHIGARDIFRMMSESPFAQETRATIDPTRSMEDTVRELVRRLPGRMAAE